MAARANKRHMPRRKLSPAPRRHHLGLHPNRGHPLDLMLLPIHALRAIAAISVALCHFSQVALLVKGRWNDPIPGFQLAAGVDLFFVISGFIMVYASEALFGAPGGPGSFLARRLARIAPLYWAATMIAIPMFAQPYGWTDLAQSLLFIPYRSPSGHIVPLHGVGWTLNYEMFFYALFAVALLWRKRAAVPGLCALFAALALFGAVVDPEAAPLQFWSRPIVLEFAFGMLIATLYRQGISLRLAPRVVLAAAAIAAIALGTSVYPEGWQRVLWWGLPAAAIVAAVALGPGNLGTGRIAAAAKLLGNSSYSIYLVHPLMGGVIIGLWPYSPQYLRIGLLALGFVATIALSVAVFWFFERHATRALRARSPGAALQYWPPRDRLCPNSLGSR